jgi:hypothetical protein
MKALIRKILFRNGLKNNSPRWAFLEGFEVPDFDNPEVTYLARIRIIQTPWFGVYVHRLGTPDARKSLHNHPWPFVSFLLRGQYTEMVPCNCEELTICQHYAVPRRVRFMNIKPYNKSWHWIDEVHRTPVWTLVFVGRRRRTWGYMERDATYYDFDKSPYNAEFEKALAARGGGDVM